MIGYLRTALLILGFVLGSENARAEGWPIKKFVVQERVTPRQHVLSGILSDQGMQLVAETSSEVVPLYREIEEFLNTSAAFFEVSGFPPPNLASVVELSDGSMAYPVYIAEPIIESGEEEVAHYLLDNCVPGEFLRDRYILLWLNKITSGNSLVLSREGRKAVAHELFHAIQYGSAFIPDPCLEDEAGAWIVEGTADAAGWVAMLSNHPDTIGAALREHGAFALRGQVWGLRNHSRQLSVPNDNNTDSQATSAYRTSGFWLYLAEWFAQGGKPNTPGINPYNIGYLAEFFSNRPFRWDCDTSGSLCRSEIAWLDRNTRSIMGAPLREIFARFVQAYALYGSYRGSAMALADPDWLKPAFDPCQRVELSPRSPVQRKLITNFEPIAAKCFWVEPKEFGRGVVNVIVTVRMPSGANGPRLEQLTSVTADGSDRLRQAESDHLPGDMQRAEWKFRFIELGASPTNTEASLLDDGTLLFLTNVADDAEHTGRFHWQDDTELEVTFTVIHEYAALGPSEADGGDTADAINTPLEMEFTKFNGRVQVGQAVPSGMGAIGHTFSQGIVDPCTIEVTAHRDHVPGRLAAESLYVALQTSGPITKDIYPVRPYRPIERRNEPSSAFPRGEVVASVHLYDVGENGGWMNWESGTLTIDHIDRHMVTGRISGVAHHRERSDLTGEYLITESRALAAVLSVQLDSVRRRCAAP